VKWVGVPVSMLLTVVYFASVTGIVDFGDQSRLVQRILPPALALPAIAICIVAWRRNARRRRLIAAGFCPCGYNRAGLAAGVVCPECGAAPAATTPTVP